MKFRYAPLALACALMGAGTAQAAPVTYSFGGTLNLVDTEQPFVKVGDSFTGSFTFESSSMNVSLIPNQATYIAAFALDATINGYSFSSSSTASDCPACGGFSIFNDYGGTADAFTATSKIVGPPPAPVTGPNVNGFEATLLRI